MEAELEDSHCSATTAGAGPPPPPPPPPPPTSYRDRRCPVHSLSSPGPRPPSPATPPLAEAHPRKAELLKSSTIRQHYYPEGGWGWLVCACAFSVHLMTSGLQLAYGALYPQVVRHYGREYVTEAGWLGAFSMSVSHFLSPFVIAVCQRKSTRLTAVFGGLVLALACLFTSFAQQMHQTFVSYGLVLGLGVAMCRETADLMVGQYFKRRREAVDVIVQTGTGIGAAIFSVLFREAIGAVGWRLGLQVVTGVLFSTFIVGMLYRSASLYHPQRRAILHLKYQKKKVKEKSGRDGKTPYVDLTTLKTRTMQIIMVSTGISSLGIYAPLFYMALQCEEEGLDANSIITLQTFFGFAFALGNVGFGLVVIRHNDQCFIARQYLLQASLCGLGMAILALATIKGYHGYVLFSWMYGLFLGGYHYSLKVYTYEKTRAKHFTRAWGFVQWAKALPVLFGVPITGYINRGEGSKVGFYLCSAFAFAGALCLFLMNLRGQKLHRRDHTVTFSTIESRVIPPYVHSLDGAAVATAARAPPIGRIDKCASFATSADGPNRMSQDIRGTTFDDEYYGCDCITSCDKVERAFVFSEYENDLCEEEEEDEAENKEVGGANAWGGANDRGRGEREPIADGGGGATHAWGGAEEWQPHKETTVGGDSHDRGGGASEWGGDKKCGRGDEEPIWSETQNGGGANVWGGVSECGRGNEEPIWSETHNGGGANVWGGAIECGRGKREPMTGEALVEEDEEKVEDEGAMERVPEEEATFQEVAEKAEDDAVFPLRNAPAGRGRGRRGRGGRSPRARRSSITVVEEMTTSV